ncbi:MAG: hypothetical protein IJS38_02945 [Erysipelotrichaceae bacterium]|nr:hypothetical protein [Erysipelotrichaceae bacterium]
MNNENEKRNNIYEKLSLIIALGFFLLMLIMNMKAIGKMAADYRQLNIAGNQGLKGTISYDDHFYGQMMFGIEIVPNEIDGALHLKNFQTAAVTRIDNRITGCGILYAMFTTALMSYFLYSSSRHDRLKQVRNTVLTALGLYVGYIGFAVVMHLVNGLPISFFGGSLLLLAVSLFSLVAGSCALITMIRVVRHKKAVALAAIAVVFALFLVSSSLEGRLYSLKKIESFAYIAEIDPRYGDPAYDGLMYYDETRNVVIIDDKEYPPQEIDNPEYLSGLARVGALLFEGADPYSGSSLYMMAQEVEMAVSPAVIAAYLIKAAAWIFLATLMSEKREEVTEN